MMPFLIQYKQAVEPIVDMCSEQYVLNNTRNRQFDAVGIVIDHSKKGKAVLLQAWSGPEGSWN